MNRNEALPFSEAWRTFANFCSLSHTHTYTHVSRQIRTRRNFKETRNRTRNFVWMNFTTTTTERNLLQVGEERESRERTPAWESVALWLAVCLSGQRWNGTARPSQCRVRSRRSRTSRRRRRSTGVRYPFEDRQKGIETRERETKRERKFSRVVNPVWWWPRLRGSYQRPRRSAPRFWEERERKRIELVEKRVDTLLDTHRVQQEFVVSSTTYAKWLVLCCVWLRFANLSLFEISFEITAASIDCSGHWQALVKVIRKFQAILHKF